MSLRQVFTGVVKRERVAVGSKSEHEAVVLDNGKEKLKLQIKGGNPFHDAALDAFVGKKVSVEGILKEGRIFIEKNAIKVQP